MFGKVKLKNDSHIAQILIPASALVGTTIQPKVYNIKNGKAILTNITISERIENKVVVANGLNEGDEIVTNGFINLFDGANVILK